MEDEYYEAFEDEGVWFMRGEPLKEFLARARDYYAERIYSERAEAEAAAKYLAAKAKAATASKTKTKTARPKRR